MSRLQLFLSNCLQFLYSNFNTLTINVLIICLFSMLLILILYLFSWYTDKKRKLDTNKAFGVKHPKINAIISLLILLIIGSLFILIASLFISFLVTKIKTCFIWINNIGSSLDKAIITAIFSLVGAFVTSVISKIIDYKAQQRRYLAQQREKPYQDFVEMVYKIQRNTKDPTLYKEEEMMNDFANFSSQLTLWGSKKVAKKWVEFRLKSLDKTTTTENLYILEEIMNEMRNDLGTKRIKKGGLLSFFINDLKDAKGNLIKH